MKLFPRRLIRLFRYYRARDGRVITRRRRIILYHATAFLQLSSVWENLYLRSLSVTADVNRFPVTLKYRNLFDKRGIDSQFANYRREVISSWILGTRNYSYDYSVVVISYGYSITLLNEGVVSFQRRIPIELYTYITCNLILYYILKSINIHATRDIYSCDNSKIVCILHKYYSLYNNI